MIFLVIAFSKSLYSENINLYWETDEKGGHNVRKHDGTVFPHISWRPSGRRLRNAVGTVHMHVHMHFALAADARFGRNRRARMEWQEVEGY